ncbi:retropepsin-like aspartic protease family protein [Alteromonas gilva]|uniref:Retropepsin-like aspartic protease n=1 Tax=Alteromonas gilva TaxID=2987522 RepID=A0ABT5L0R7_9ALTE|nr:retropepsin-like aspartic protease [Alteromonas gilva]MDC8830626.1 retropepsin-like aspartic protease [Alteromonas gilva]
MMWRYNPIITLCLCASIALNGYLLWPRVQPEQSPAQPQPASTVATATAGPTEDWAESSLTAVPPDAVQTRATPLSEVRQWLNNGDYARVERYLINALREAPHSPALLLLEADLILATKPLSTAVLHFYTLLELTVFSPPQHAALTTRTETLVSNAIDALYNARDWDLLARFIEPLYQLNSSDEQITLKLAEAYARQQKFTLMEDTLASLAPDHAGARSIRQRYGNANDLLEDSALTDDLRLPAEQPLTRLALTRYGDQYIVDARILQRPVKLLIDTGASSTAISFELYRTLKRFNAIKVMGLFDVRTAGGLIRSPLIRVQSMQLGPYELTDIGVLVLPRDTMLNADGLLGMNVLKQFNFKLEQGSSELLLTPR